MSTELTDPVSETETVTSQDIGIIILNMNVREIEFHIQNSNAEDEPVGDKKIYFNPFSNMGATQQQDIRDVLNNTRQYARSIGVLGAGEDSDDISE